MTATNRKHNATSEVAAGEEALAEAKALLEGGFPKGAVSRANYAAYHLARALLLSEGLQPRTHRGVASLLVERFEATGRISRDVTSLFARLQTFRELADYMSGRGIQIDRARDEVEAARAFMDAARSLLRTGGWLE